MSVRAASRIVLALLACAVAAASALGCGSGSPASVLDPVAKAATTTSHAEGAKLAMHMRMSLGSLGGETTVDANGQVNFKNREADISMGLSGLPGLAAAGLGEDATLRELFTGGTAYVGSDALAGKLPGGARWIKINIADAARSVGLDPSVLSSGQSNPAQFLDFLRASGGNVQAGGTDTVRGVTTTRYSASLDIRKVAAQLSPAGAGASQEAVDKLVRQLGVSSIPVQVWVDAQQLVRRFSLDIPMNVAGQRLAISITLEFFDFGPTPPVKVPAASETYEVSTGALGAAGSGAGVAG